MTKTHRILIIFLVCLSVFFIAANVAASLIVPKLLEEQCSRLLGVPVRVEKAGINFLSATFWVRNLEIENPEGMSQRTFLSFRRFSVDLGFVSLLARQLIFESVQLKEPVFNIEKDSSGRTNLEHFREKIQSRFRPRLKLGKGHFFTGYEIHQFSVKNGTVRFTHSAPLSASPTTLGVQKVKPAPVRLMGLAPSKQKRWTVHHLDFSFSHFVYPPQIVDPIPISVYLNAKVEGVREGAVLILGSGNFFAGKKNFRIRSDFKNLMLREANAVFPDFPLLVSDGFLNVKSELNCHDDFLGITNDVTVLDLKLKEKPGKGVAKTVFGYPRKDVIELVQNAEGRPLGFGFQVAGNLNEPDFNVERMLRNSFERSAEEQLAHLAERMSQQSIRRAISQPQTSSPVSKASFAQSFEQWTGIKLKRR